MKNNICFEPFQIYSELKPRYPGVILLIRFKQEYKCFDDDAELVIKYAGLEKSSGIHSNNYFECSFPYDKADQVLAKLAKTGFRIGICDPIDECSL